MHVIKPWVKRESGFTLIETIVGVAILATAGLALVNGISISLKAENVYQARVTSENLARSEMEYVVRRPYSSNPWSYNVTSSQRSSSQQPSWWDDNNPPLLPGVYSGYLVSVNSSDYDADMDGIIEVPGDDSGIRKVTINVYRPETNLLVTLETRKANR